MRQVEFGEIEDQARAFAELVYTETTKRTTKRKRSFDESVGTETQLDPRETFKVDNLYTILDCLRNEVRAQSECLLRKKEAL